MIAIEIAMTESSVQEKPTEIPAMMLVAGPVLLWSAMKRTGRYLYSV